MKIHELDQQIFDLWHITDDLKTLLSTCENNDVQMNIITGLIDLYHLKFSAFHENYEEALREFRGRIK